MVCSANTSWSSRFCLLFATVPLWGCVAETDPAGPGAGADDAGGSGGAGAIAGAGGTGATGATGGSGGAGAFAGTGGTGGSGNCLSTGGSCPDGVVCVTGFPCEHSSTTAGAASDQIDAYSCEPSTNESGPEVIYRVDVPEEGLLALELSDSMSPGTDIDVHLLGSLDPATCVDRGHWRAGALLAAGSYWVTADTWVSGDGQEHDGSYTLTFGLTRVTDLTGMGMNAAVAANALWAFDVAWAADEAERFTYAVTDFSLPSDERRGWIVNLATGALAHNLYVPHGEGSSDPSDSRWAIQFSNLSGSHQSSLGVMLGAETYTGTYGYSLRLDGLEPGYNDNVRSRAIVVHPWDGSTDSYVGTFGECAPTWGCPGLDPAVCAGVVDSLSNGGLLLFHYPDGDWSTSSAYLP